MTIPWIDGNSMRLFQASTNQSVFPTVTAAVSCYTKHLNVVISAVSPVEIVMNPVERKASDKPCAYEQQCRRAVISTQVFPANTSRRKQHNSITTSTRNHISTAAT